MKHYIIDAHNVLHKIPEAKKAAVEKSLAAAHGIVTNAVARLAERFPVYVFTLVFDSPPECISPRSNITLRGTKRSETADEAIKSIISAELRKGLCVVISSDMSVFQFARKNGCEAQTSEQFLAHIQQLRVQTESARNSKSTLSGTWNSEEKPAGMSRKDQREFRAMFGLDSSDE